MSMRDVIVWDVARNTRGVVEICEEKGTVESLLSLLCVTDGWVRCEHTGRKLDGGQVLPDRVAVFWRLCGGKGGFGAMLRGGPTGLRIKKTTNFDACRDLSGRRLRNTNAEQQLR